MKQTIGQRISEARRARGMKQEELAEAMGVSAQAVSKWENDISCPDISILPSLAERLGMTVDELLTGKKEAPVATLVAKEERKDFSKMMLHIRVNDAEGDKVNINLPLPLISALLHDGNGEMKLNITGGKDDKFNINWNTVMNLIESGVIGKILEVESSDGDTVEIVVE